MWAWERSGGEGMGGEGRGGEGGKGIGGLEKEGRRGEGKHVQLDYQFIITPSQIRGYSTNVLDRSKVKVHCLDTNLAWRE